jgi:hypothetical protein
VVRILLLFKGFCAKSLSNVFSLALSAGTAQFTDSQEYKKITVTRGDNCLDNGQVFSKMHTYINTVSVWADMITVPVGKIEGY